MTGRREGPVVSRESSGSSVASYDYTKVTGKVADENPKVFFLLLHLFSRHV